MSNQEDALQESVNFEGYGGPSEHRTVGPHRAYCLGCSMWCYPGKGVAAPCVCCANALYAESSASPVAASSPSRPAPADAEQVRITVPRRNLKIEHYGINEPYVVVLPFEAVVAALSAAGYVIVEAPAEEPWADCGQTDLALCTWPTTCPRHAAGYEVTRRAEDDRIVTWARTDGFNDGYVKGSDDAAARQFDEGYALGLADAATMVESLIVAPIDSEQMPGTLYEPYQANEALRRAIATIRSASVGAGSA